MSRWIDKSLGASSQHLATECLEVADAINTVHIFYSLRSHSRYNTLSRSCVGLIKDHDLRFSGLPIPRRTRSHYGCTIQKPPQPDPANKIRIRGCTSAIPAGGVRLMSSHLPRTKAACTHDLVKNWFACTRPRLIHLDKNYLFIRFVILHELLSTQ